MPEQENYFSLKSLFVPLTTIKAFSFIAIIGIIVFFNGLFNGFVGDDYPQIIYNLTIQSFNNIPAFFSGSTFYKGPGLNLGGIYYKPLLETSYSLTYSLFGPNYFAYHLFELLIFIINACLVFLLFKSFFNKPIAFILSIVFLIHPINSESAFYISDTQETLFFLFGMIALLLLKKYHSQKALIVASLLLLLSLLSKETGHTLCFHIAVIFIFI